jgi:hypothetical protein
MKTKSGKSKRLVIPICSLISEIEALCKMVLTPDEIITFNTYSYFLDFNETSLHLKRPRRFCMDYVNMAERKLKFLYSLKSPKKFLQRKFSKQEFLNVPIIVHKFSTRLYHNLMQLEVFNLKELNTLGVDNIKIIYGVGNKQIEELISLFERNGYLHLLK